MVRRALKYLITPASVLGGLHVRIQGITKYMALRKENGLTKIVVNQDAFSKRVSKTGRTAGDRERLF